MAWPSPTGATTRWDHRFDGRRLRTVAGDKAQGATRWGLVRDRLTGPLDERYGLLEGPLTVAAGPREGT